MISVRENQSETPLSYHALASVFMIDIGHLKYVSNVDPRNNKLIIF